MGGAINGIWTNLFQLYNLMNPRLAKKRLGECFTATVHIAVPVNWTSSCLFVFSVQYLAGLFLILQSNSKKYCDHHHQCMWQILVLKILQSIYHEWRNQQKEHAGSQWFIYWLNWFILSFLTKVTPRLFTDYKKTNDYLM